MRTSPVAADTIADLAKKECVERIVIGLPKKMDNTEGSSAEKARAFGTDIAEKSKLAVVYWDERLTTVAAHGLLSALDVRGKKRKAVVDTVAASLILEGYMEYLKRTEESS